MKSQVGICSRNACASTVVWLPFRFHIRAEAYVGNVAVSIRPAQCWGKMQNKADLCACVPLHVSL